MKMRIVRFIRTSDYDELFSGDPTWVTESIGGMGEDGRSLVTKSSFRVLQTSKPPNILTSQPLPMKTKNRWLIAASAVGIHVSIGSIYAYSAWKMPLENTFGWSSTKTSMAFSIAIFFLGLSAAFLGRFIEKKGASKGGLLSAAFFCTGLIGSAAACWFESLTLFYLFFGIVAGIGLGVGYISPVSTLVKSFPDRRGLATGLAIMGFGFGGLICAKLIDQFVPTQAEVVLHEDVSGYAYSKLLASDADAANALLVGAPGLKEFKENKAKAAELFRLEKTENAVDAETA